MKPGEASSKPRKKPEEELSLQAAGDSDLEIPASRNVISSSQPLVLCYGSLSKYTAVYFNPNSQIYMLRLGKRRKLEHCYREAIDLTPNVEHSVEEMTLLFQ